jgi:hypothetical protein
MGDRAQLLNDQEEGFRLAFDGRQVGIWTALPGIITAVDFSTMTCSVQPALQATIIDENGATQLVNLPLLIHVPVVFPSAGGFTITLPLKVNDEVLVVFSSRCIDSWWQSGGIQKPMEARMHDLSDGFAIPGPKSLPNKISGISSTGAQIRNDAGTTYIEIAADGKIKLVSPSEIDVTGNLSVTGNITATGTITGPGGIGLTTHKHSGVQTGSGTSGTPVP